MTPDEKHAALFEKYKVKYESIMEADIALAAELRAEWEFFDDLGRPTWPWSDDVAAGHWLLRQIENLERIHLRSQAVLDLTECPIDVIDWPTYLQAQEWSMQECVKRRIGTTSEEGQRAWLERYRNEHGCEFQESQLNRYTAFERNVMAQGSQLRRRR